MTFLATNLAPLNDLNEAFQRTTIETGGIEGFSISFLMSAAFASRVHTTRRATDTPSRKKIFTCRPTAAVPEERCAQQIVSNLARHAFRQPPTAEDMEGLMEVYKAGRKNGDFDNGIEMSLRAILAEPKFIYRAESEPASLAAGQTYRISDIELRHACRSFLEQQSRRRTDESGNAGKAERSCSAAATGQTHARRSQSRSAGIELRRAMAESAGLPGFLSAMSDVPRLRRQSAAGDARETELFFGSIVREDRNVLIS